MDIVSTYRLQFHRGFTFRDAIKIIPYLRDLGITHIYASPYLKAVSGSVHGYDVIDHSQINPDIGTLEDFKAFVDTLSEHGMSHILDTVPNHMGVDTNDNQWWNDVLQHGISSTYAHYFDIDWNGIGSRQQFAGKVLLPVLGETFAQALEEGRLKLEQENVQSFVHYGDRRFPVDPKSDITEGLSQLVESQHYRLSYWRVGSDEINYRRFFDISGLAGLRMERQEVFDGVHNFTLDLIAQGAVVGLRVDHPDGLLDPQEYFTRLQTAYHKRCPDRAANGKPLYVAVEKILNGDEELCREWPVSGTSGYDFLWAVNDLFVDSGNELALTEVYDQFTNDRSSYADWVYRSKCLVLDTAMYSEMAALTSRLDALAQMQIASRDFTRRQLHAALREIIACFSVYRSYVSVRGVSESDISVVEAAVARAAVRNPAVDSTALTFIGDSAVLRYPGSPTVKQAQLEFAQRFQQLTSPVNAKGIEDCSFYIYNRLTSLNEVGCDPGRFGRSLERIHQYLADRSLHWPHAMSALSTHDTKRSEDVRARISVLSEIPHEWAEHLERWRELNAGLAVDVHPNDQYLLYQTLLGAWPSTPMDQSARDAFATRLEEYMRKATREAKQRNSWVKPDENYEAAISVLIRTLLDPVKSRVFLEDFIPSQKRVARLGMLNSLSQTVLRLAAPGISDTYQGSELWDLSLVDPDNRRPVDYEIRKRLLGEVEVSNDPTHLIPSVVNQMNDGRIKLLVTTRLLQLRKKLPALFLGGSYQPLQVSGKRRSSIFAFARTLKDQCLIVVVPRLLAAFADSSWGSEDWGDTQVSIPMEVSATQFKNSMTGQILTISDTRMLDMSAVLTEFPVFVVYACADI